jgi:hypothetical protein
MNNQVAIQPGRPAGASRNLFGQRARMRKDLPAMLMVVAQFREAEKSVCASPGNGPAGERDKSKGQPPRPKVIL